MNATTQVLVFVALAGAAGGTYWLATQGDAANVRTVEDLEAAPERHVAGSFVLMAVPEPASVPFTGQQGVYLTPNPAAPTALSWSTRWTNATGSWFSAHTLALAKEGDHVAWQLSNATRANPASPLVSNTTASGSFPWQGDVFAVRGFDDGDGHTPMLWALLPKASTEPIQPKPSQFTGRLATSLPDATPLPPGVLVYEVSSFTVGCSSKFLPPEEQARATTA